MGANKYLRHRLVDQVPTYTYYYDFNVLITIKVGTYLNPDYQMI